MASSSSNNCFAALSGLKTPLGKYVLERVSSGDTNAATGSNAIPVAPGNNKYATALKSKVSTEPTLRRRPALILGPKKLPPNVWATSASHPGPSSPRKTSKLSPQAKSYVLPSKRATALKRATTLPLPKAAEASPSNWRDQFPPLVPRQFLWSPSDQKMNSGSSKSFSHIASKGVKTGSKQSFRSKEVCFLLGVRLGRCLRTGFLSRRMRKTYLPHKTFRPLEPHTQFMWHGKWLMRMMMWHWEKEEEMEGIWWESEY